MDTFYTTSVAAAQKCEEIGNDMENTVDKFESLFRKAESDLEYMSRKLEDEFREQLGANNQLNPSDMMQRLQRVRTEYNSLVREAAGMQAMQSEMTSYFKAQLQTACSAMKALQESAPEAPADIDSSEQEECVRSLSGMKLEAGEASTADDAHGDKTDDIMPQKSNVKTEASIEKVPVELTQTEKRAQSDDLVAISEEEFESVSPLVRGRSKLADVNIVYRVLFEYYKENNTAGYLTTQDMTKKGLRIAGATGEAKLKVLRTLKILHIAKNGAVKLL